MNKVLVFLLFVITIACSKSELQYQSIQGNALGTTYSIQYFTNKSFDVEKGIDSVLYSLNKSVSTYIPNSDISKINKGDTTIVVDKIFNEVFSISEKVNKESNGYFDPTVGVLRNSYGFGTVKPIAKMDSTTLDSLRQFVGFNKVSIRQDGTIKKKHPQIYFDFNAVAKGYGIDMIGNYLSSQGVKNYLIELGGELLAKGENLNTNKPWKVGIEAVESPIEDRTYTAVVSLKNTGMASSGNYRKFRIDSITGKKYVHTINPLTGEAEQTNVTSATVIAPTCALADAYATACMAMGLEKTQNMLSSLNDIEVYLTYIDKNGNSKTYTTKGFDNIAP
ncbi:FAD:protein FMN transferase [Patiriisocius hiemis]|uniref:FAD:protein FMN transferase n=1 Tax=Patiriisocius hiemis TaxID=3075604 RepID=A0ABU2YF70_9FLAO|nr:FAD:protein FMN transferase [Constantimarinum sp. W242]MDT0556526.1 FAD:protein FMN transferase [Constantimarinum sp. W242]